MDLSQKKLVKEEWEALEIPVSEKELEILKLIRDGYDDIDIRYNLTKSLFNYMKIGGDKKKYDTYFYKKYFEDVIKKITKKYGCPMFTQKIKGKLKIKKANQIRIMNSEKKMDKKAIYEYILLDFLEKLFKNKGKSKWNFYFYTLEQLLRYHILNTNEWLVKYIKFVLSQYNIEKKCFIENSYKMIEQNNHLIKYRDISLYKHQKQLFNCCKQKGPKLVLFQAPTGMGKTIAPVGLAKEYKLIFVCAAKHIGLQFARACISMEYPIAVAFGCNDPGDIRLHYYAAKDIVKNRRTGGIFRVDNSVGDKVQIMISDIQSYLPAMRYMMAFNSPEQIIWYWDEPTITLDKSKHEYHAVLEKNWRENEIPNIVLSSATLPMEKDIMSCIQYFKTKTIGGQIYTIKSYECSKTIPLLDRDGYIILPHYVYESYEVIKEVVKNLKNHKTILRHFDIKGITKFLIYADDYLPERYKIENYFDEIDKIDAMSIKLYYVEILSKIGENYDTIYNHFQEIRKKKLESQMYITTSDAHTLTDGPTLFLAEDVEKIGTFCIKSAKISSEVMEHLLKKMNKNDKTKNKIESLERQINNVYTEVGDDVKKTKKNPKLEKQEAIVKGLYKSLEKIQLDSRYIPNSFMHLKKWGCEDKKNAFTSMISESVVEEIMMLHIDNNWKILLMMGIGVFKEHNCIKYTEIMKKMANEQKLYLIIASTDYIYGTNYQFCHGYMANDLKDMTQEKMLQAFGRIGRMNMKQDYSLRLRDKEMIDKLLKPQYEKKEADNMNRLFGVV